MHETPLRGSFHTVPLREGGATDALITKAVELALICADERVERATAEAYDEGHNVGYDKGWRDGESAGHTEGRGFGHAEARDEMDCS